MKRRKRNLLAVLCGFAVLGALLLTYTIAVNQQTSADENAGDDSSVSTPDATVEAVDADSETTGTEQSDTGAQGTTTEQPATTAAADTDGTVDGEPGDPAPPPVRAVLADDQVVIEGEVASQEAADTLVELMEPLAGPGGVVSELVVNPAAPEVDGVSIAVADEVVFPPGSDEISPQFFPTLDQMVAVMQLSPEITVVVEGHTDSDGNEVDNLALSQRRAEAVVDYIAANSVNRFRLEPRGRGSGEPIDDNATDEGRRRNRRIEFEVNGFDLSL